LKVYLIRCAEETRNVLPRKLYFGHLPHQKRSDLVCAPPRNFAKNMLLFLRLVIPPLNVDLFNIKMEGRFLRPVIRNARTSVQRRLTLGEENTRLLISSPPSLSTSPRSLPTYLPQAQTSTTRRFPLCSPSNDAYRRDNRQDVNPIELPQHSFSSTASQQPQQSVPAFSFFGRILPANLVELSSSIGKVRGLIILS